MQDLIKRTPYAILVITLSLVIGATWLAAHMSTVLQPPVIETFKPYTFTNQGEGIYLTAYNTYWIGATDGLVYLQNMMDFKYKTYQFPTFPTDAADYKPFMEFKIMNNTPISVKEDVNDAMRNSYATNNSIVFFMMTYNPVVMAGVQPDVTISISTTFTSNEVVLQSEEYVNWTYSNTKIQQLYSYLQLNAEQIDPMVYYRAAYACEQLQMGKLAAFYYRYNIFLNGTAQIVLTPGTYKINPTSTITLSTTTTITYYYDYGNKTTYPDDATIAYPLFYNNQIITIKEVQFKFYSPYSIYYFYSITVTGDPYPPYSDFTNMLKAAEILLQNYGPNDAVKLEINDLSPSFMTDFLAYTYTNALYPTALIYAYTGISPEPFPGFNNAYLSSGTEMTLYEYLMPIYPAFVVPYGGEETGYITASNLSYTSLVKILGSGNLSQTIITYFQTGTITFTATIPLIISKGEATKTIIVSIIPADNTNTSWTTTITTTYRCISKTTISLTVTLPATVTAVTGPVLTKDFYALITITEEFPLYPTVPLYNVLSGTTTYIIPETTTYTGTKTLVFTTYITETTTTSNAAGNYIITSTTTTYTTVTLTFTTTALKDFTTIIQDYTLTADSPTIFQATFTELNNKTTIGRTTITVPLTPVSGVKETTITVYTTIPVIEAHFFTKTTSVETPFSMAAEKINSYMKSLIHLFTVPENVQITMYIPTLSLSPTVINGTETYIAALTVYTKTYTNTTTVSMVTRNPYVTATLLVARYTFNTSTSSTSTVQTNTSVVNITVGGKVIPVTSYYYTILQTTYYYTTFGATTLAISFETVSIETEYNGTTFINQTLTEDVDTYAVEAMSAIYTANRSLLFNGEILATRLAAANLFVGYAELDNYRNLVNIRNQWIISPFMRVYQSYSFMTITTVTTFTEFVNKSLITTSAPIYYNSYTVETIMLAINTGYINPFEALLFKAPASPVKLFTSLLKINYPGQYGLDYTTYYLTTIFTTSPSNGAIIKITSTVYSSAAAFLLLTETANPQDNVIIHYVYAEYTTTEIPILDPLGNQIGSAVVPYIISVLINTTSTYPVVQYYLSNVPYVYILPIPTGSDTQYVKYFLTILSYNSIEASPVYYITTQVVEQYGTTYTFYVPTTTTVGALFPESTVVAYISPVYLGIYLLYGMTDGTSTVSITGDYGNSTTETYMLITGSFWINNLWYVPWAQELYVPVTVTTTVYIQTMNSGTWSVSSQTYTIIAYALQVYQNVNLPRLTYNASLKTTMQDFANLVSILNALTTYTIGPDGAAYVYTNVILNNVPIYMISATGSGSWVVAEYMAVGSVPIIYVPSLSGSYISLNPTDLPNLIPASYTPFKMTGTLLPEATFGITPSSTQPIAEFYYTIPYYAAFYNIPMYAPTATSLPPEWSQAPDIMMMYLPQSSVITVTYPLTTMNSLGLPVVVGETTRITTVYYGFPLPYTFTSVTVGNVLLTFNPFSTTAP